MGVQLNIKDEATVLLARRLADSTGRSVTETIRLALERDMAAREVERLEFHRRIKQIADQFRADMPSDWHGRTSKQIMDDIHDADSLPT